jgi:hypothetical protein
VLRAANRRWRAKQSPDMLHAQERERRIERIYGITAQLYDAMVLSQDGRCAICNKETKRLSVDHNHQTNAVRALLCTKCNALLGQADDNPEVLQRAIEYLLRFG